MANDAIQIEFKVLADDFKSKMSDMQKATTDLNRDFKLQKEEMKLTGSASEKLEAKVDYLSKRYDNAKTVVKETKDQLEQAKSVYGENSQEVATLEGKLKNAEFQQAKFKNELTLTSAELAKMNSPLEGFKNKMDTLSDGFKNVGEKLGTAGAGMTKMVTGPILAIGAGMIGLATKSGAYADRLLDLSDITGMTTDSLQEWQHVAVVAGVDTEVMSSAVEGLVKKLPSLQEGTGKSTDALNKMGLSYDDIKDKSPDEQVDILISTLAEMEDPLERNAIGAQLFGGSWKDVAPILGMGADGIKEIKDEAKDGVISNDALKQANDFRIEMDKMKETLMKTAMQIGSDLAPLMQDVLIPILRDKAVPAIQSLVEKVQDMIKWWQNLSPEIQALAGKFLIFITAIGPVLTVFSKVFLVISKVITVVKLIGVALAGLTAPVAIAIGVVTAFAIAGVLIFKNWDKIKEFFINLWERIKTIFSTSVEAIKTSLSSGFEKAKAVITTVMNAIKAVFTAIWNGIKKDITTVINAIKTVITTVFNAVKTVVSTIFNGIKTAISTIWNAIKTVISTAVNNVKTNVTTVFNAIKTVTTTVWNAIKSAIMTPFNSAKSAVTTAVNAIKTTFTTVFNAIKSVTSSVFNAVKGLMTNPINSAKTAISGALNAIKGFFSNLKLKFPKITPPKLPSFSMTGKFSLTPPSVPKLGIKWKSEGAIFRRPTVLNGIGVGDGFRGLGSGMEAVLPIDKLAGIIQSILPKQEANLQGNGTTVFQFNGNYEFRDKDDIDYFLNESALRLKRRY